MKFPPRSTKQIILALGITVTALFATIRYAVERGQDGNWDQQNYHIAIPFLLERGTFWKSIGPTGIQSYFNPYVLWLQFMAFMLAGSICKDILKYQKKIDDGIVSAASADILVRHGLIMGNGYHHLAAAMRSFRVYRMGSLPQ